MPVCVSTTGISVSPLYLFDLYLFLLSHLVLFIGGKSFLLSSSRFPVKWLVCLWLVPAAMDDGVHWNSLKQFCVNSNHGAFVLNV